MNATRWPTRWAWLVICVAVALGVGAVAWLSRGDRGACDLVDRADVESVVSVQVSDGASLTDDSNSGASGCGFTTHSGATVVSVWIGAKRDMHGVFERMRADGLAAAGTPKAYVVSLGFTGESAVSSVDDGVVLVNAPGHSGAAVALAQLIATRL